MSGALTSRLCSSLLLYPYAQMTVLLRHSKITKHYVAESTRGPINCLRNP